MKTCPFCDGEIDEAVVSCNHCGRGLHQSEDSRPSGDWRVARFGLHAILAVSLLLFLTTRKGPSKTGGLDVPSNQLLAIQIHDGSAVEIEPGRYLDYAFEVPGRTCTVSGQVVGAAGPDKVFEGFVLSEAEFSSWKSNGDAVGYRSGRVASWSPKQRIRGPGRFHLVVSNAFSTSTANAVSLGAKVDCP